MARYKDSVKSSKKGSNPKAGHKAKIEGKKQYVQAKPSSSRKAKQAKVGELSTKRIPKPRAIHEKTKEPVTYKSNDTFDHIPTDQPFLELTHPQSIARLIYPNPVCMLTSLDPATKQLNAMTISWLMPLNNYGGIALTMHKSRHSAFNITQSQEFILSVPTALQRKLLLEIGKCSGQSTAKFTSLQSHGLEATKLGRWSAETSLKPIPEDWKTSDNIFDFKEAQVIKAKAPSLLSQQKEANKFSLLNDGSESSEESDVDEGTNVKNQSDSDEERTDNQQRVTISPATSVDGNLSAVAGTIAHMRCEIKNIQDGIDGGHHVIFAQVTQAFVHPKYWNNNGKCFVSRGNYPPILTFLGSQCFGFVEASNDEFPRF